MKFYWDLILTCPYARFVLDLVIVSGFFAVFLGFRVFPIIICHWKVLIVSKKKHFGSEAIEIRTTEICTFKIETIDIKIADFRTIRARTI